MTNQPNRVEKKSLVWREGPASIGAVVQARLQFINEPMSTAVKSSTGTAGTTGTGTAGTAGTGTSGTSGTGTSGTSGTGTAGTTGTTGTTGTGTAGTTGTTTGTTTEPVSVVPRTLETLRVLQRYPDRAPVWVSKDPKSNIPDIPKHKYLVPLDFTVGQFIHILRRRLAMSPEAAMFVYADNILPPPGPPKPFVAVSLCHRTEQLSGIKYEKRNFRVHAYLDIPGIYDFHRDTFLSNLDTGNGNEFPRAAKVKPENWRY